MLTKTIESGQSREIILALEKYGSPATIFNNGRANVCLEQEQWSIRLIEFPLIHSEFSVFFQLHNEAQWLGCSPTAQLFCCLTVSRSALTA